MTIWRRAALAGATAGLAALALAAPGTADANDHDHGGSHPSTDYAFAVIGDIPYGDAQLANLPSVIAQINADPAVRWVDHLGDIKSGSSVCSDDYFATVKSDFDRFQDPLVYTVGDNEWTDCHRVSNGAYDPLERLARIRSVFFPHPGTTLGRNPARVRSQADQGIPEDVRWERAGVSFAALHIVGSNNSLAPWTGNTAPTPEQTAEVLGRTAAVIQEIHDAFLAAKSRGDRAVTLLTQADMFDPTVPQPLYADWYGFTPIVQAIARESAAFRGKVYLFNGDSHVFNSDQPLATGSPWIDFYKVPAPADNLVRTTVDGSTGVDDYLRVTVHRRGADVLTVEKVPFAS